MSKKKTNVEILRFILCVLIVMHHTSVNGSKLPSGMIIADLFFVITGYFTVKHMEQHINDKIGMGYAIRYTLRKLCKTLPYVVVGTGICYVYYIMQLRGSETPIDYVAVLSNLIYELTLTSYTGVTNPGLVQNAPLWFLYAMLIALPIVSYLCIKCNDVFRHYLVWFIPPMIEGWMQIVMLGPAPTVQYSGIVYCGVIRAFGTIMLGGAVYYAAEYLNRKSEGLTATWRLLLTVVELGLLCYVVYRMRVELDGYSCIFVLFIMALMLTLMLSGISYTSMISGRIFEFLGKLSLPVYCIHWGVLQFVESRFYELGYWKVFGMSFAISIGISVIVLFVVNMSTKNENIMSH